MGAALVGIFVALVVGLLAGSSSARAKRARLDYRRTRAMIPAARKLAWDESVRGVKVMATAIAVMLALAAVLNALGRR